MQIKLMLVLTLLLSGRAMTLAFIHRVGGQNAGDPPAVWLMPLIGDAVIGIGGVICVYLILLCRGLWVWTLLVMWNALGIWDALSAFIIHKVHPWPEFFMVQIFGSSMFFIASAMHLVNLYLLTRKHSLHLLIPPK